MSMLVLDDIFYTFHPLQEEVEAHSIFNFSTQAKESNLHRLIVNTPFEIIPELIYTDGNLPYFLELSNPYLTTANERYRVDTWWYTYSKCAYYIPNFIYRLNFTQIKHWMTCLAIYSQAFFDNHPTGIWVYRLGEKLFIFLKIDGKLHSVKTFNAASPDDGSYAVLKMLEAVPTSLSSMTLWTNEADTFHLQILYKYVANIQVDQSKPLKLLHQIMLKSCAL